MIWIKSIFNIKDLDFSNIFTTAQCCRPLKFQPKILLDQIVLI